MLIRRLPLTVAFASGFLLVAACGSGSDSDDSSSNGEPVDHPIVVTHEGGLLVLDGDSLEVAHEIERDEFLRLNPAGTDDHVLVSSSAGFEVLDAASGELMDVVFDADTPGHVVRHADVVVLFADGTGEITVFDPHDLESGELPESEVFHGPEAHHGVAVQLDNGDLLYTLGDDESRVGAEVVAPEGAVVARSEECPGVHGEAMAEGEVIIIGCEDGVLLSSGGEFTKVDSPDDYGRIGNQAGDSHSPVVLGDYKVDPDAELERPTQVSLVDSASAELMLVDLPASYTFRSLERGPNGEALVLGIDGAIHVIDPDSGDFIDSIEVIAEEWEEPLDWQQPRPAIFVRGGTAYVSDPLAQEIHSVDLERGDVMATVELDVSPNELSGAVPDH